MLRLCLGSISIDKSLQKVCLKRTRVVHIFGESVCVARINGTISSWSKRVCELVGSALHKGTLAIGWVVERKIICSSRKILVQVNTIQEVKGIVSDTSHFISSLSPSPQLLFSP